MTDQESKKTGKVTLDIELGDLINMVSKSSSSPISSLRDESFSHSVESEDLKKAWFKHMLLSMEKLNDLIETVRRVDISNLKNDIKEEIKSIDRRIEKAEDDLKQYKKDVIEPINNTVITLTVKLGLYSALAGFIGSGFMAILIYILRDYLLRPSIGGP
jgi:hypothetical protein